MNDETTLLPCPFCGGEAELKHDHRWPDGCDRAIDACIVVCPNMDCNIYDADDIYYCTESEAIAAWNTRATHGTLTAEQVREAWTGNLKRDCLYDPPMPDWQAIADELNELGSGTCEPKWTLQGKTQTQEFWRCECGNCGYEFGVEDRQSFPWHVIVGSVDIPNFCPECGVAQKAVKR